MAVRLWEPSKVDKPGFLAIVWTSVVLSLLFLSLRFYSRRIVQKRFFSDDCLVIVAWLLSFGISIIYTVLVDQAFEVVSFGAGLLYPAPRDFPVRTQQFYRSWTSSFMVFYTSLWCIKLSFLLFFHRLIPDSLRSLRWHWWGVLAVTVPSYAICFATLPYPCTFSSFEKMASPYCTQEQGRSFISAKVNCALDVFTDVLIVTIPINILWRTNLMLHQRLALLGIFSLVVATIIFAIIRAAVTTSGVSNQMDPIWLELWTILEMNVAIIVACVGSFRTLFTHDRRTKVPRLSKRMKQFKITRTDGIEVEDIVLDAPSSLGNDNPPRRPSLASEGSESRQIAEQKGHNYIK